MRSLCRVIALQTLISAFAGTFVHAEEGPTAEAVVAFLAFGLEPGRPDWFPSRTPGDMVEISKVPYVLELQGAPAAADGPAERLMVKVEKLSDCSYRATFDAYLERRAVQLVLTPDFSKAGNAITKSSDDGLPRVAVPGLRSRCQSATNDCALLADNELGLNNARQDRLTKGLAYFQAHICAGTSAGTKLPF